MAGPITQIDGEPAAGNEPAEQQPAPDDSQLPEMVSPAAGDAASGDFFATPAVAEDHGAPDPAVAAEASVSESPAAAPAGTAVEPEAPTAMAEPELVEVWRPGGRSEERRGQRRPPQWQRAHQPHGEASAKGAATEGATATEDSAGTTDEAVAPVDKRGAQRRRPGGPQGEFRRDREDGGERRRREHRAEARSEHQGSRPERGSGERANLAKGRGDRKDRRDFTPHREREKQADPNSPFAKLAALKAQLEAAAKERR
jgi:ATP-dependent RNA helicase SUPV3L1/SUV3